MRIHKRKAGLFRRAMGRLLKKPVALIVHDNAHVFLNARFKKGVWRVRLHWMFLKGPKMASAIASYILKRDKKSSQKIDQYIENHWHWVRHPLPLIRAEGKVYDLKEIFDSLNRRFWRGKITSKITWGPDGGKKHYEQLQMGSYSTSRDLITIHPRLDRKIVPRHVVEATVFHEMCHAAIPVKRVGKRRQIHPPEFKKLEARYPHLKKALAWEDRNLGKLFRKFA